jgi:type IV pilus assembly protein PilV
MLLEALVAILIFSISLLALVGMQAMAVRNVGEAKYRADASFLPTRSSRRCGSIART